MDPICSFSVSFLTAYLFGLVLAAAVLVIVLVVSCRSSPTNTCAHKTLQEMHNISSHARNAMDEVSDAYLRQVRKHTGRSL